ncbi:hypothetical protein KIM372_09440 [Bombiscardovia nodaiensis]|uniref:Uncharacterized protein n=1 Tax=Bombiscardovia nodaiensis TaxID=2932181 RepID=A0ABM8B825_9BIFI|nr:hypothetical protein KIM372_09440 [Bombiscardovia nodaiensis]
MPYTSYQQRYEEHCQGERHNRERESTGGKTTAFRQQDNRLRQRNRLAGQ